MATAREILASATARLSRAGVPSPAVDAELLLAHVTGRERLMLRLADPILDADVVERFEAAVGDRERRVPLQHITGAAHFRHLRLSVGPGVFVPRPETEVMVEAAISHLRALRSEPPTPAGEGRATPRALVVDLCTGSAAIALSLAVEVPGLEVIAVELSATALAWAQANLVAVSPELDRSASSVRLVAGDATTVAGPGGPLEELAGRVALVISNPPYVPSGMVPRDAEVRDHDPGQALFAGPDGLAVIRGLVGQSAILLAPGGLLLVEHADVQGEDGGALGVPGLFRRVTLGDEPAFESVSDHTDLSGRPRFTTGVRTARGRA